MRKAIKMDPIWIDYFDKEIKKFDIWMAFNFHFQGEQHEVKFPSELKENAIPPLLDHVTLP